MKFSEACDRICSFSSWLLLSLLGSSSPWLSLSYCCGAIQLHKKLCTFSYKQSSIGLGDCWSFTLVQFITPVLSLEAILQIFTHQPCYYQEWKPTDGACQLYNNCKRDYQCKVTTPAEGGVASSTLDNLVACVCQ